MKTYEKLINKLKTEMTGPMSDDVEKVFKVLCDVIDEDKPCTITKNKDGSFTQSGTLKLEPYKDVPSTNIIEHEFFLPSWEADAIEKGYRKGLPTKKFIEQHHKKRGGYWSYSSNVCSNFPITLDVEDSVIYVTYLGARYGESGSRVKMATETWKNYFIPLNKHRNQFEDPMKAWNLYSD